MFDDAHHPWQPRICHEPISASIGLTALLGTAGFGAAAGTVGGLLVTAGLSLASSFIFGGASQALQARDSQSQLAGGQGVATADEGVRQPVIKPVPEQRLALGTATSSGVIAWQRDKPPFIWRVYLLAAHECGEFDSLIINGKPVILQPGNTPGTLSPIEPPFFDGSTRFIEIAYRNGDDNQVMCPILARDFPSLPSSFRQRGTACVTIKAHYGADDAAHGLIYGADTRFNPLFRFQGAKLIDPRVPGLAIEDPATWVRSSSASLCVMRWLYHQWPDMRLLDPGSINWDLMAAAADVDDEMRGYIESGAAGTERNHTCNGIVLSNFDPLQKLKELLTSCDGFIVSRAGKYHILPGAPREPAGTIHQDMLAGGFELHTETPDRDLINTVKTEMIAPDRDYKPTVGPVLVREDLKRQDGRALETTLSLPFTEGGNAAARPQRLASRVLKESRGAANGTSSRKALSATFFLEAKRFKAGDVVRIWFKDFPKVNGTYLITRAARDETLTRISMDMVQWDNTRFGWSAPTDQKPFTLDANVLSAEAA